MKHEADFLNRHLNAISITEIFTPTSIPQPTSGKSNMTVIAIFVLIGVLAIAGIISYLYCRCYANKMNRKIQHQLPEPFTTVHRTYHKDNSGLGTTIDHQSSIDDMTMVPNNNDHVSQDSEISINGDAEPMIKKKSPSKTSTSLPHNVFPAIFQSTNLQFAGPNEASDGIIDTKKDVEQNPGSPKHYRRSSVLD